MVPTSKIIGVMSCGVVLGLALMSGNTVSTAEVLKDGRFGERIGGQAGRGHEQAKQQGITAPRSGERIGGQAGRGYEQEKKEHVTAHAGERIGGQAGQAY